ncbi:MAG: glycosyltransferase family 2 protein, partial [Nocardioides sp.]
MPVPSVAVLLVSHDGARWLPGTLEGLAEQADLVARVIAVDTGSRDDSVDLLTTALTEDFSGRGVVLTAPPDTSFPQAVAVGVEHLQESSDETPEWVWLLHDDSRPAPGALAALLEVAAERTGADILGPKLREWPSLRRLLELGVTISGTGRRETGLERGEYDQGQHDDVREVLAVNTAGMLVRYSVLEELDGFDPQLPIFGNDIDFGWRAATRGHTTLVVPQSVVFHAEAAHRGVRQTPMTGRHTHYQERRAAIYTMLVNGPGRTLPWRVLRLVAGTALRMLGFLAVRSPGEALDDLAALVSVLSRPSMLRSARADRAQGEPARAAPLLAPYWVPYRHGLDFVGDLVAAVTNQAADVAERRRIAAAELDPSSQAASRVRADEDDELSDTGIVARFLTNPVALTLSGVVLVAVVASRTAIGSVTGGALSPVPSDVGDWWSLHLHSWHQLGLGTDVPAPPYVPVLALLASVVGTTWAVSLLMLLAVPFALWGSWRFLRVAGRLVSPRGAPRWLLVGGATTYALVPVTSGAWAEGRLGLVVATALVPWVAHAAVGFADPDPELRQRSGWRVGLLLGLATAFAPLAWFVVAALVAVVLLAGRRLVPGAV